MSERAAVCIHCGSRNVVRYGKQSNGRPRCRCKDCGKTFQTDYVRKEAPPETREIIIKMSLNGSGERYISRSLGVDKNTVAGVLRELKVFLQQ